MRSGDKDEKQPMIVLIHGGPFSTSIFEAVVLFRQMLMLQGYSLLILNYRGSTGYGSELMDSLLGQIGV